MFDCGVLSAVISLTCKLGALVIMLAVKLLCCSLFFVLTAGQVTVPQNGTRNLRNVRSRLRHVITAIQSSSTPSGGPREAAPRTWRELMTRGHGVHSVLDFISLLTTADHRPLTENDVFVPNESRDGKRVIRGGGLMAVSDECSPRNVSVRLDLDYSDAQLAYYPECTMVERCGGCTPTQFLSCEPLYKERIVLQVLTARYQHPGAPTMQWEGYTSVQVERHRTCHAVCTLRPEDCGRNKRFSPMQCKCQCMRLEQCSSHQRWDEDTCSCRCRNQRACCPGSQDGDRTCNLFFDHTWCECTLKTAIGASPNASGAEIEAWLASRFRSHAAYAALRHGQPSAATTTTTTTWSTSTTTPTTTEVADPCGHLRCPRHFLRIVNPSGVCVCQAPIAWRRRRYQRRG